MGTDGRSLKERYLRIVESSVINAVFWGVFGFVFPLVLGYVEHGEPSKYVLGAVITGIMFTVSGALFPRIHRNVRANLPTRVKKDE